MRYPLIIQNILRILDLRKEIEDFETIHNEIEKGIVFKGTNLWILVFAIVVASVGLNTNSTAVIIGAMLISPLMGPINGMGYSIATYDFFLFRKSFKNYGFAVIAGLIASTIYFAISPVSTAHSELLARTNPTIYDVLIALFGGLSGIVAISSKLKGNVIPGVAIATALMPPLCTAGYGLATAQFNFFFGAMYLFTINTVFIGISAVLVSQFLNFPIRALVDPIKKKRINQYITLVILITCIPSIYFGYVLVQNEKFYENAQLFVKNISFVNGAYLLKNDVEPNKKTIRLIYGGNALSDDDKSQIRMKANDFKLEDGEIIIEQGFATNELSLNETEALKNQLRSSVLEIKAKEAMIDSILNRPSIGFDILKEIKPLYPQILTCAFSESTFYSDTLKGSPSTSIIIFEVDENRMLNNQEKAKVRDWLKARLKRKDVVVFFETGDVMEQKIQVH